MSKTHLSPESATAHAYDLPVDASEARHLEACGDCARRVRALRMDRAALTQALETRPPAKARLDRLGAVAAAIVIAASATVVGYALMAGRAAETRTPAQDVERWIDELGSESLERRERAMSELRERAAANEASLRRALERATDPETRGRIESLLKAVEVARRRQLACVTARGIEVFALDGSSSMSAAHHSVEGARNVAWSPDGRSISYLDSALGVHVFEPLTGRVHRAGSGRMGGAVWSRDGKRLAWVQPTGLGIADTDWRSSRTFVDVFGFACFWSADDSQVYMYIGRSLVRVSAADGTRETVMDAATPATASWDRTKVVFLGGRPDGRRSYSTYTYPLECLDVTTGRVTTVASGLSVEPWQAEAPGRAVPPECPVISPDGGRVAFVRTDRVCVVATTGGEETVVGEGRGPAWSPDGERLAFERADGRTVVRELATGKELTVEGGAPVWSPVSPRP